MTKVLVRKIRWRVHSNIQQVYLLILLLQLCSFKWVDQARRKKNQEVSSFQFWTSPPPKFSRGEKEVSSLQIKQMSKFHVSFYLILNESIFDFYAQTLVHQDCNKNQVSSFKFWTRPRPEFVANMLVDSLHRPRSVVKKTGKLTPNRLIFHRFLLKF